MKKKPSLKNFMIVIYTLAVIGGISVYAHKPATEIELIFKAALICGYIALLYSFRNPRRYKARSYGNKIHFS